MIKYTLRTFLILFLYCTVMVYPQPTQALEITEIELSDTIIGQKKSLTQKVVSDFYESQYKRTGTPSLFIPKGEWLTGVSLSYNEHQNDNYKFLIIENWDGMGYGVNINAFVGYALKEDMIVGFRVGYNRSLLTIDNLDISINEDLSFGVKEAYSLDHTYYGTAFMRNYMSLFNSKRFGLFNDTQVTLEMGQGKLVTGTGEKLTGTYKEITKLNIGIAPGMTAFVTDNVAIELSIGILGFNSKWIKQTTNQVEIGSHHSSAANFKIDLFSLKFGIAFYFNGASIGKAKE